MLEREMKRLFKIKYPKLMFLAISIIIAYMLFKNPFINKIILSLDELNYLGIFIAGFFFSFGFTTPFAIGFLVSANIENLFAAAVLGGLGSVAGNLLLFKLIKISFTDEFKKLENTKRFKEIEDAFSKNLNQKLKIYVLYIFVGVIMASPIPDELAVTILAGSSKIKSIPLAIFSLFFHSLGILVFLLF